MWLVVWQYSGELRYLHLVSLVPLNVQDTPHTCNYILLDLAKGDKVAILVDMDSKCLKGTVEHFNGRTMFVG